MRFSKGAGLLIYERMNVKAGHKFTVIDGGVAFEFEAAEEGGYVVSVPAASGCWSEGDTFEEALEMIKDALVGWVEVAKEQDGVVAQELETVVSTH